MEKKSITECQPEGGYVMEYSSKLKITPLVVVEKNIWLQISFIFRFTLTLPFQWYYLKIVNLRYFGNIKIYHNECTINFKIVKITSISNSFFSM